jgi:hypothetical protein
MGFFNRNKKSSAKESSSTAAAVSSPSPSSSADVVLASATNTSDEEGWGLDEYYNPTPRQYTELGSIRYVNLTKDGKHGEYEKTVDIAKRTGRPIFANFVEWSGWAGCKDAGRIFDDPDVKKAAEELFVPAAFNTWDRGTGSNYGRPHKIWGAGLESSWWGYLRVIDSEGKLVVTGTRQITGYKRGLDEVKQVMREGLEDLGINVPDYLQ